MTTKQEEPAFRVVVLTPTLTDKELGAIEELLANRFIVNDTIKISEECSLLVLRRG